MSKKSVPFILLLLFLRPFFLNAQSNSIEIWIRSFIPDAAHAGAATKNILKNSGGSGNIVQVIPKEIPLVGPLIAAVVPTSCFDPDADRICFITDNRGFSSDPATTARTDTKFTLTFNGNGTATVTPTSGRTTTGLTKRLNCATGAVLQEKAGHVDLDALGAPAVAGDVVQVIGQISATDQLVPCAPVFFTPSADCSFDLKWNRATTELTVDFTFGVFPAFEIYARQPGNAWIPVFQQLPLGEAWQLAGDGLGFKIATTHQTFSVKIPALAGKWQSSDPDHRFAFEINGSKLIWTEQNATQVKLTREVPMVDQGNGNFRIERANDDDVLNFLGFAQKSLRDEILSKNPLPSFISFRKEGETLRGEWNGLIVTKLPNGHLNDLVQPGIRPPKLFSFSQIK